MKTPEMTAAQAGAAQGVTAPSAAGETGVLLEHLCLHQVGWVVAHFARLPGSARLGLAEESMQEAMLRALHAWPYQKIPENPAAWLFRVAHNAAIDFLSPQSLPRVPLLGTRTRIPGAASCRASTISNLTVEERSPRRRLW